MATGDMKNNIKQLQTELKAAKYSSNIDVDGMVSGSPKPYLAIYHYLFTTYSTKFNKDISNSNNELYGKSDMRFMEAAYKILRDMFDYKPQINREQFFATGFAERKVIMATDILRLVRSRYKPPKNSTFKVAATREEPAIVTPREKVQKEPFERPRKVASKSHPDVSGAIVLPVRSTSASGGGFKIPKSATPGLNLPYDGPLSRGSATASAKGHKGRSSQMSTGYCEEVDAVDVTAASSDRSIPESRTPSAPIMDQDIVDAVVKRKVVDMVSPALIKMNERIGQLDVSLKSVEQRMVKSTQVFESPSAIGLTTGLTKQMNDVLFKLDTLTSRVVLIENRLMMVESRLDDDESYRQVLSASYGYRNSGKPPVHPSSVAGQKSKGASHIENQSDKYTKDRVNSSSRNERCASNVIEVNAGGNVKECDVEEENKEEEEEGDDDDDNACDEGNVRDIKVTVTREDKEMQLQSSDKDSVSGSRNHEQGTDEDPVNQGNLPTDQTQTTAIASDQYKTKPSSTSTAELPFDDMFSPIRPYSDLAHLRRIQDESAISIPCASYEADTSTNDRRASTPTQLTLDISTLDRVSRINQMMAETKQLFH